MTDWSPSSKQYFSCTSHLLSLKNTSERSLSLQIWNPRTFSFFDITQRGIFSSKCFVACIAAPDVPEESVWLFPSTATGRVPTRGRFLQEAKLKQRACKAGGKIKQVRTLRLGKEGIVIAWRVERHLIHLMYQWETIALHKDYEEVGSEEISLSLPDDCVPATFSARNSVEPQHNVWLEN